MSFEKKMPDPETWLSESGEESEDCPAQGTCTLAVLDGTLSYPELSTLVT